jgi:hypothetical protein
MKFEKARAGEKAVRRRNSGGRIVAKANAKKRRIFRENSERT